MYTLIYTPDSRIIAESENKETPLKMTKVVHCKKDLYDVYIGRPSIWGNPYRIGRDGTREEVIEKYRKYIQSSSKIHLIEDLRGKTLGCWCKPNPCHGDILVELLERIKNE